MQACSGSLPAPIRPNWDWCKTRRSSPNPTPSLMPILVRDFPDHRSPWRCGGGRGWRRRGGRLGRHIAASDRDINKGSSKHHRRDDHTENLAYSFRTHFSPSGQVTRFSGSETTLKSGYRRSLPAERASRQSQDRPTCRCRVDVVMQGDICRANAGPRCYGPFRPPGG